MIRRMPKVLVLENLPEIGSPNITYLRRKYDLESYKLAVLTSALRSGCPWGDRYDGSVVRVHLGDANYVSALELPYVEAETTVIKIWPWLKKELDLRYESTDGRREWEDRVRKMQISDLELKHHEGGFPLVIKQLAIIRRLFEKGYAGAVFVSQESDTVIGKTPFVDPRIEILFRMTQILMPRWQSEFARCPRSWESPT